MLKTNPIDELTVNHVSPNTVAIAVKTTANIALLWPYVRAHADVPSAVRAVNHVFAVKVDADVETEVRAALIADAEWRWDRGYVNAARYSEGWVFVWSAGER